MTAMGGLRTTSFALAAALVLAGAEARERPVAATRPDDDEIDVLRGPRDSVDRAGEGTTDDVADPEGIEDAREDCDHAGRLGEHQ